MNVFGGTTAHILDVDYLGTADQEAFGLKPSANKDWFTGVNSGVSSEVALRQGNSFLDHVQARVDDLFIDTIDHFIIDSGPVRRFNGVIAHEKTLMGNMNGQWHVFAKVDIAYGAEDAIDAWDAAECTEWFPRKGVNLVKC
jgi:hypothetical protein